MRSFHMMQKIHNDFFYHFHNQWKNGNRQLIVWHLFTSKGQGHINKHSSFACTLNLSLSFGLFWRKGSLRQNPKVLQVLNCHYILAALTQFEFWIPNRYRRWILLLQILTDWFTKGLLQAFRMQNKQCKVNSRHCTREVLGMSSPLGWIATL